MKTLFRRFGAPALAALFSLASIAPAQSTAPVQPQPAPQQAAPATDDAPARPALWKVADADTTIYLFGTIHALPKDIDWLNGKVVEAFDGSEELVTEILEPTPEAMQNLVMTRALLPKGQTLRGMLSAPQRKSLEAALGTLNMPLTTFDMFEPWYAAIGLATLPLMREGFTSENGVESVLDARAKASGRPHSALETMEFQINLFDSLPVAAQKTYLTSVATQLPSLKDQLGQMISAWKRGDADGLAKLMNADEDDPALIKALLIDRNRTWADWIKQRLDKPGAVFIAVGAGHLAGPGSVQDQLKTLGLTSERVQ